MLDNIDRAINGMYLVEHTLLRRRPTMLRLQREGWHMQVRGTMHTPVRATS